MKFAIMGAGGLGCYYGGMLARAGETVHFIARGAHLEALQRDGLHVESAHVGDFHLPRVHATDDPATIGPVDTVLMGVKAYDLAAACEAIRPLLGAETVVVPLLNGADMAERIGAAIGTGTGAGRVLGGTCFASSNLTGPGRVRHVLNAALLFGELGGGHSARGESLEATFRNAGVNAGQSGDIRRDLWHKYIIVSPLAGVCSVARLATRRMAALAETRALYEEAAGEVHAVARAAGVHVADDAVAKAMAFIDSVGPQHTVSTLLDLRAGRRLELDAMVGTVVRLGAQLGVPTPVSRVLHHALKPYENGPPEA
jgi:2-dehydropantoate 2-reductase